ncbi:MAG: 30S ribosomal protein S2 [Candidatus Portnoybacteria bacterium]|nr:30S ribosomal protein S2 [Candidatus Portnoybacteria bacterium]
MARKKVIASPAPKTILGEKDATVKEMFQKGLHWGHRMSRWHPRIKPYLYGVHRSVHVFDLNKTYECFERALEYLRDTAAQGKTILFIGTRGLEKELVQNLANETLMPAVWGEWAGGTLTNFKEIAKRIKYFKELEAKIASGELEKYTKKERHDFAKEHAQMKKKWEGIKNLERLPDAIFLTNIRENALALKEASTCGIPVAAVTDTNTDPTLVDYPIPANDDALTSMQYILEKVKEAILRGKSEIQNMP